MSRVKTFVATGLAPDGRLYAGDLNAIQDHYMDGSGGFSSTLDVGVIRIGDASLQILKYGAGELRITASLRVDGILRGLGGIVAGAFTTTQRDAIPLGSRPYGLIILNTTTNRYEWNAGTDASPNWQPLGQNVLHAASHAPGGSDALDYTLVHLAGTRPTKPAASSSNNGLLYFETDWGVLWRSNGSSWVRVAQWPQLKTVAQWQALPTPLDGDTVVVQIDGPNGIDWHLKYNAGSASPYKWEFVGGSPLMGELTGPGDVNYSASPSYVDLTAGGVGPQVVLPVGGDYDISAGCNVQIPPVTPGNGWMSYQIGATGAQDADRTAMSAENLSSGYTIDSHVFRTRRKTGLSASTIVAKYKVQTIVGKHFTFQDRYLIARPVRVAQS